MMMNTFLCMCIMLTIVSNSDSFNSVLERKSINLAKTRKADDVAVAVREREKVVYYYYSSSTYLIVESTISSSHILQSTEKEKHTKRLTRE